MFQSVTASSEARAALYIVTAALIGSVIMGLVANFH
jgi:hypothetical protein